MKNLTIKKVETIDSLGDFEYWGGAVSRYNDICRLGIEDEAFDYIADMLGDSEEIEDVVLNDIMWFEMDDFIESFEEEEEEEEEE